MQEVLEKKYHTKGMYTALITEDDMIVWVAATKAYKNDIEAILEVQN